MVSKKQPAVQILIGGSGSGFRLVKELAFSRKSSIWPAPKLTAKGDSVLFYIVRPVSSIVAAGRALSNAKHAPGKRWEARIGNVRLLPSPIALAELRKMFPDWPWLRHVTAFAYVSPERAASLLRRSGRGGTSDRDGAGGEPGAGAGFGDTKKNRLVERAAIKKVVRHLKRRGFRVVSRERDGVGYDLEATKNGTTLHVEVKGISGTQLQFPVTGNEVHRAETDSAFRLLAVTSARTKAARIHAYTGSQFKTAFKLKPLDYMAAKL